jgi:MFS family permease
MALKGGENVVSASFKRIADTLRHIRRYRELFKYLIAFLIYNDGIGTIIGVAAIYGAELGFGATELILALLLVQFVGIPYSLIFGRLPSSDQKRRPFFLAFIVLNLILLPIVGIAGSRLLPPEVSGARPAPYTSTAQSVGEGLYGATSHALRYNGEWQEVTIPAEQVGADQDLVIQVSGDPSAAYELPYYGQRVRLTYSLGPDYGKWAVFIDDQPAIDPDTQLPLVIDGYNRTARYDANVTVRAIEPGEHILRVANTGERNPESQGIQITLATAEVLPPERESNLLLVIGMVLATELVCLALAFLIGKPLFSGLAAKLNTKRSILLALLVYSVIAVWGYFLDSVVEFWFLAWMVAIVQGGSQALSRSLYAAMSPAAKSGEFFGLFGVMEKFSAIIGPAMFAAAGVIFGSSRPAVLSLIVLFILGGWLLTRVNVEEGKSVAQAEDAELLGGQPLDMAP